MNQQEQWEKEFDRRFTAVDWSEKRQLIDIVGLDLLPHLKDFIRQAISSRDTHWKERVRKEVEGMEECKSGCDCTKSTAYHEGPCVWVDSEYIRKDDLLQALDNLK